jgi:hypothetical protein
MVHVRTIVEDCRVAVPPDALRQQLTRARWRLRMAAPGSPEWDAALTAVEDLERRLTVVKVRERPAEVSARERVSRAEG